MGIIILAIGAVCMWMGGKMAEKGLEKLCNQTKTIEHANESIGFDIKAKRSEIEDNTAMDNKIGFKVKMEDSTFKRNTSKGTLTDKKGQATETKNMEIVKTNNQNDKKGKIIGNLIINCNVGVSGSFDDTEIKHNLTDSDVLNKKSVVEKINILDNNLLNFEKIKDSKSIFEQSSFYQTTSESYGAYGEWEKAITYAYKSFELYLKIPLGDNPFIKTEKDKEDAALFLCAKLNFYANTVRKESGKNYIYFLNELLKLAKRNNSTKGIKILEERIALEKSGDLKK
ncbi:MAG: hypothetical protein AABZ65_00195 [Candidatus Omnitrophota bacterium]